MPVSRRWMITPLGRLQTALTSYWFIKQGFKLAYETPVAGAPWSIPFEFPIYQAIVAGISKMFNLGLDGTGRLVSYLFLLLTILPAIGITKRLKLPDATSLYFVAILFSMPIYVYWGRSFMIETAALFFTVVAIKFFLDYLLGERSFWVALAFVVFSTLAVLQKATTPLPILLVLSFVFVVFELARFRSIKSMALIVGLLSTGVLFLIPIVIGYAWVEFSDQVKLLNPLGKYLTSTALAEWNWGTLSQRVSSDIWTKVVWGRILSPDLGALFGVFLLASPFLARVELKVRLVVLAAISLGIVPLFVFTNLHLIHSYYQTANAIFFAYAASLALAAVVAPILGGRVAIFALMAIISSNYISLSNGYLPLLTKEFTKENRDLAVGGILNRELPPGMQFVAFGNDWSSTFSYISKRKSFTVPDWFKNYDQVVANPSYFLEKGRLGAIVSCATEKPTPVQIYDWARNNGAWKVGKSNGCLIVTPEKKFSNPSPVPGHCQGHIDIADVEERAGEKFFVAAGWMVGADNKNRISDDVVLKVSGESTNPIFLQALRVPRLDVNHALTISGSVDVGFSRITENMFKPGSYQIEMLQDTGNGLKSCGIRKNFEIR